MRLYITLIVFCLFLLVAIIFGIQNNQTVLLHFMVGATEMTVAAAVSLFTFIGFILGVLFSLLCLFFRWLKSTKNTSEIKGE